MISALTPLFFPITPPFLLHFELRDAAALRAHPSSSRAVNKPPHFTPPNMCELHLFLPFLLLSVQLFLEEHVFPSFLHLSDKLPTDVGMKEMENTEVNLKKMYEMPLSNDSVTPVPIFRTTA